MSSFTRTILGVFLLTAAPALADSPSNLITGGKIFGELRYRYEWVEQAGLPRTATADTVRANLGFETGSYKDFKALVEGQSVLHIGDTDFNDTTNGKVTYPVIADPDSNELQQAWIMWSGIPKTSLKVGRQHIILSNQRFFSNVGWRQNDQTYNAATVLFRPLDGASLQYSYVWNINRIFGENNPIPDFTGNTHIVHGEYAFTDWLKISAYAYLIDIKQGPAPFAPEALSSQTYGAQATGKIPMGKDWSFQYLAEYASQADYNNSPVNYREAYYHFSPGISWKNLTLKGGFESLGGNGTNAMQAPLGLLHAFNGWADKFLNTPAGGLEDAYGHAAYKIAGLHKLVDGTVAEAAYHDFKAENFSMDYGKEWNFQISKTFKVDNAFIREWSIAAKYADYNADGLLTDTNKAWLVLGTKF